MQLQSRLELTYFFHMHAYSTASNEVYENISTLYIVTPWPSLLRPGPNVWCRKLEFPKSGASLALFPGLAQLPLLAAWKSGESLVAFLTSSWHNRKF